MIARIAIVAVAVATWGLPSNAVQAQNGTPYPAIPTAFSSGATQCADAGCTEGADAGCCNADSMDGWLSSRRLGLQHHPNCSCPRCHPRHMWASFDALMWWGKGRSIPALVTTEPNSGVLPDATILFGNGSVGNRMAGGARTDFGFWLDECETLGMGARLWGIDGDQRDFHAESADGSQLLARPFYNILLNDNDAFQITTPGLLAGSIDIESSSSVLATEAYLRSSILAGRGYNVDLLGGYHFVRLDDELSIRSLSRSLNGASGLPIDTLVEVVDMFDARNEFHGGELGVVSEIRRGPWTVTSLAKMSVGNMRQEVRINGAAAIIPPASPPPRTDYVGGLLALDTNIGTYTRNETAWIPEFGITAAYEARSWLRLTVGYNLIWFSNVVFSGDQIDTTVNPSYVLGGPQIGPLRPAFDFRETEYWLQGLTLGATLTF